MAVPRYHIPPPSTKAKQRFPRFPQPPIRPPHKSRPVIQIFHHGSVHNTYYGPSHHNTVYRFLPSSEWGLTGVC